MENSFFEYQDRTSDIISSDEEIDDSFIGNRSGPPKVPPSAKKNQTVFVPESEDSESNEDSEEFDISIHKPVQRTGLRSGKATSKAVSSSDDDDVSRRGSIRRHSGNSASNVVLSSSDDDDDGDECDDNDNDEEQASPEIVPRQRPIRKSTNSNDSPLIRRVKKRMILTDSENDNSIIIENDKHKKVQCLKDTPVKEIDNEKRAMEIVQMAEILTDDERADSDYSEGDEYEGPDEDEMVMSKATRMSIMGIVPQGSDSDESDFIQSDESDRRSRSIAGSTASLDALPDVGLAHKSPTRPDNPDVIDQADLDSSKLSCSTFGSPVHEKTLNIDNDKTRELNNSIDKTIEINNDINKTSDVNNDKTRDLSDDVTYIGNDEPLAEKENIPRYDKEVVLVDNGPKRLNVLGQKNGNSIGSARGFRKSSTEVVYDEDVTIIDSKPEIIALSSDDEYEEKEKSPTAALKPANPKTPKKSPDTSTSQRSKDNTMKQYLLPPSYPNQGVVYVKKSVKENELSKLKQLQEDLQNVRYLLEHMDVASLPDGGAKLSSRLQALEDSVRSQGDKVANMVEEPDNPTAEQIAKDGFDKGLSWEDIQKASNQVQPRMFGKQAMATHMAERSLMLDRLRELHAGLSSRPQEHEEAEQPRALASELMQHQRHALAWLRWREGQKPAGGILADDMGLGKTITMISLILSKKEEKIADDDEDEDDDDEWNGKENSKLLRGGTLVVCPASLLQQWGGEVARHCRPHALQVCLHHGASRATQPRRLIGHDMVVTTYNLLQRDLEKNGVLMRIRWARVILDEAHIVRNHKSQTSMAVSALKASSRWCLTGTPVQNKDLDVFALLKFLRCSPFDDLTIWKKWIDNKQLGGQERLSTIMRTLLLRRTKAALQSRGQLGCLPRRQAHQRAVTLDKDEMNVYQKVLVFSKTLFAQFLHQRAEKNQDSANSLGFLPKPGKDDEYAKMHKKMVALQGAKPVKSHEILVLLLRLRQVCCHCGLIGAMLDAGGRAADDAGLDLLAELSRLNIGDKDGPKEEEEPDRLEEGTSVAEAIRSVMSADNPVFKMSRMSSKIRAVMDCLRNNVFVNKGHKAVVVSQWTSVLKLVETELNKDGVKSVTLSGQVPVPARPPLIQALNDPASNVEVMLLSLCAGGVGLNLCGANHLLLLDPHWNPQLEEQAQDRIYRVGQKRDVHIYRFMCLDTVEQSIRKLQEAKLELADNVLTGARNNNASKLTIEDLKTLFNMGG